MNALLLSAVWLAPLLAAVFAFSRAGRFALALAPLPALAATVLVADGGSVSIDWLLLGLQLGLGPTDRIFLAAAALVWLAAGLHSAWYMADDVHSGRFRLFFLLSMAGSLGLIVAQDMIGFYLGFSLMGLAAYGLVVHEGRRRARRAALVYLAMTLVGEMALFAALVLIYQRVGSLAPTAEALAGAGDMEIALLILAFGIKAGLPGLHLWLPLAHPAAPVAASAVLSGVMIKAALVGWMRFLPLGVEALPGWGAVLIVGGLAGAFLGTAAGLVQRDPKVLLAYSSIAKMGLMSAVLGLALAEPSLAPGLTAVLALYAAHHGLAKGALFLGVGVVKGTDRYRVIVLLALPALVIAGAPFTSGAALKKSLVLGMQAGESAWVSVLEIGLTVLGLTTVLLMGRFLYLMHGLLGHASPVPLRLAWHWFALVAAGLALPLALDADPAGWSSLVPLLLGSLLVGGTLAWRPAGLARLVGAVAPGDLFHLLLRAWRSARRHWQEGKTGPAVA